ncbi:MAG: RNA methyltransferase [Lachnospiraceae bacterium]|nr:RNA methyltransferase [Lachnospiraceae bacterium]
MEKTVINSTSNHKMKEVVRLLSKAKERREQGVFVGEGLRMFLETPPARLVKVYVSESFYASEKNRKLLENRGADFELVSDRVFQSVSDTVTPQGILFLSRIRSITEEQLFARRRREQQGAAKTFTYLLLDGIQDPGNLGTMVRTAEGAGVTAIICSRETVDLYNPKVIRSTMGSVYRVPCLVTDDLKAAIQRMKAEGIRVYAAEGEEQESRPEKELPEHAGQPEESQPERAGQAEEQPMPENRAEEEKQPVGKKKRILVYDEADFTKDAAILIGNEGNGIAPELAEAADFGISIPMEGRLESLNASMAAGILMYEAARQKRRGK